MKSTDKGDVPDTGDAVPEVERDGQVTVIVELTDLIWLTVSVSVTTTVAVNVPAVT